MKKHSDWPRVITKVVLSVVIIGRCYIFRGGMKPDVTVDTKKFKFKGIYWNSLHNRILSGRVTWTTVSQNEICTE